ncbi:rhomboid family intramembrane serine protease [Zhouia sp. PK063]|uniref:rhomboid family intramembrane serine protease n=1 Tax=Zhouia sp. PK063 TaxID=3373602 RepID=UPI00379190B2
MNTDTEFKFYNGVIGWPIFLVWLLWLVYWVELKFGFNFNDLGVYPRTFSGLRGIFCSPFIHGSVKHLYSNSIPLAVLLALLFLFYRNVKWKVLVFGVLSTGIFTWLLARPAYHIGASGIIYFLFSFIFFKGIFSKYYRLIAISLMVIFLYGGLMWYVFPVDETISWEGHLSGFIAGILGAMMFHKRNQISTYNTSSNLDVLTYEDAFLRHFDENGNFIPTSEMEKENDIEIDEK